MSNLLLSQQAVIDQTELISGIMYHFKFHPKCEIELRKLNKSVQDLFTKKFTQILNNPKIGKALGNKNNLNLTGLKKAYFGHKKYRIVYQVIENEVVVYLISIGKREDMNVYKKAHKRHKGE